MDEKKCIEYYFDSKQYNKKEILENKVIKRNCSEFFGAVLFMTCASGGVHF